MVKLGTRDLIVLNRIVFHNRKQEELARRFRASSRPSIARPCTVTTLCGKNEPEGGLVNQFIRMYKLVEQIGLADDSEQIYRSIRKLQKAGLIYSLEGRQQFAQTPLGEDLVDKLPGHPLHWPGEVEADGSDIRIVTA